MSSDATPAEELRGAATRLRKLAVDATPGPWIRPLNTRYKATVTGALPDGERGGWLNGIDPATGEREQCTVAMVPTWSNGRHTRQRGGRDLEYIAAVHPAVGLALAEVFDAWARMGELDPDLLNRVGGAETLAVARTLTPPVP